MSCRAEDGALLVEVTRPVSGGVEENGCSGNGSDDGELCGDGNDVQCDLCERSQ